jgi:hypothetical protein
MKKKTLQKLFTGRVLREEGGDHAKDGHQEGVAGS